MAKSAPQRNSGWKSIEARFVEVDGFEKGSIHDIPDAAFDIVAAKLEEAGVGIYAFRLDHLQLGQDRSTHLGT